jgi:hypothetical protein
MTGFQTRLTIQVASTRFAGFENKNRLLLSDSASPERERERERERESIDVLWAG